MPAPEHGCANSTTTKNRLLRVASSSPFPPPFFFAALSNCWLSGEPVTGRLRRTSRGSWWGATRRGCGQLYSCLGVVRGVGGGCDSQLIIRSEILYFAALDRPPSWLCNHQDHGASAASTARVRCFPGATSACSPTGGSRPIHSEQRACGASERRAGSTPIPPTAHPRPPLKCTPKPN